MYDPKIKNKFSYKLFNWYIGNIVKFATRDVYLGNLYRQIQNMNYNSSKIFSIAVFMRVLANII